MTDQVKYIEYQGQIYDTKNPDLTLEDLLQNPKFIDLHNQRMAEQKAQDVQDKDPGFLSRLTQKALDSSVGKTTTDLFKVVVDTAQNFDPVPDIVGNLAEGLGVEGGSIIAKELAKLEKVKRAESLPKAIKERVFDKDGNPKEPETIPGTIASIVPYIGATSKFYKSLGDKGSKLGKGILAGGLADAILYDEGMGVPVTELIVERAKGMLPEPIYNDIYNFTVTKEEDPMTVQRLKAFGEGATLGTIIDLIGGGVVLGKKAFDKKYTAPFDKLSEKEKSDIFMSTLKEDKQRASLQKREDLVDYKESPEGVSQVMAQNSSALNRFVQKFTQSRGFLTQRGYDAFNGSKYAHRATTSQAQHIATRLTNQINSLFNDTSKTEFFMGVVPKRTALSPESTNITIGEKKFTRSLTEREEALESIQKALTDDLSLSLSRKSKRDQIFDLVEGYNLTPEIASTVLEARILIDDLSKKLLGSGSISNELKEIIQENVGSYLRRSFELFEKRNFKPSIEIETDAVTYFTEEAMKGKNKLSFKEAEKEAKKKVKKILKMTSKEDVVNYFTNLKKLNKNVLRRKKDIPEPIRALMGEIKDPGENIILTVNKMSQLLESSKYLNTLEKLGKSGRYILSKDETYDPNILSVEIKGTGSQLDGKVTTPEIFAEIENKLTTFDLGKKPTQLSALYRNFLQAKGQSQRMATAWSNSTQIRNFTGAAQYGPANGINIFTEMEETWKLLNEVALKQTGKKELEELYRKHQRLGIINTNVRFAEYQELLSSNFNTFIGNNVEKLSKKLEKYGLSKQKQQYVDNLYVAIDDFHKINLYNAELKVAKEAMPDSPIEVLEEYAANIVRNTIPNYDRVPKRIQALRELPFGSFYSFPAEVVRTSYHIVKQAAKEIKSKNPVLKKRGLKRLAGFAGSMSAWETAATASFYLAGFNQQEREAIETLAETPWSKNYPKIIVRDSENNIKTVDTKYIDSFSFVKQPFHDIASLFANNEISEKEFTDRAIDIAASTAIELLSPFIDEAILTSAVSDVILAAIDDEGRSPSGQPFFTKGLSAGEKAGEIVYHIIDAVTPGVVTNVGQLVSAGMEKPTRTGRQREVMDEVYKNFSGVSVKPLFIEDVLYRAIGKFKADEGSIIGKDINFQSTVKSIPQRYINRQKAKLDNFKELFRKTESAKIMLGEFETYDLLTDNRMGVNLTRPEANALLYGEFKPEKAKNYFPLRKESSTSLEVEEIDDIISQLYALEDEFSRIPLRIPEPEKEESEKSLSDFAERAGFNIGGEVSTVIPNAPIEPDERVNKLTGLPYNETAGTAYMDFDDPLRPLSMSEGSKVITRVGRPTYKKDFGKGIEVYSEKTVTFPLNKEKTKWVTFPSVLDKKGTISSEDEVRKYVLKNGPIDPITGEKFPIHDSVEKAEKYAKKRSDSLLKNNQGGKVLKALKRKQA